MLRNGPLNSGEIADRFDATWPTISRHLAVLREARLVLSVRHKQEVRYELNMSVLQYVTPFDPADLAEVRAFHEVWVKELQPKLVSLSSRGRQIIVENSGHGIQFEAPDVLIGAIQEIVEESRGKPQDGR